MSDLGGAAAALGLPEAIVQRSAEARANATGSTVDEILAAWAGGEAPAPSEPTATAEPEPAVPESDLVEEQEPAIESMRLDQEAVQAQSPPPVAPTPQALPDGRPPVLVGVTDNPKTAIYASLSLFLVMFLIGWLGPSMAVDSPGARTSELAFSEAARTGQALYTGLGCGSCHTQVVRPIVSDVGLGAVTLSDTDQVIGTRRYGPDLSDIGSRKSKSEIMAIVSGFGGHGSYRLSDVDLQQLAQYLVESRTTVAG